MTTPPDLETKLRDAFAYRAERTTVTERDLDETATVAYLPSTRRPALVTGLAAAAAVVVAVGLAALVMRDGSETPDVAAGPYVVDIAPGAFVDAEATVMIDGLGAQQDPYSNVVACGVWTDTDDGVLCERIDGETTLQYAGAGEQLVQVTVHRNMEFVGRGDGTPVNIGGVEGVLDPVDPIDIIGFRGVRWEASPDTWITVEGNQAVTEDELLQVARGVRLVEGEWTGALPLVVQPVQWEHGQFMTNGIAVDVQTRLPCAALVPATPCDPVEMAGALGGGVQVGSVIYGFALPDVARVAVAQLDGSTVDASLIAVPDSTLRVWWVDSGFDEAAPENVRAYDADGEALGALTPSG